MANHPSALKAHRQSIKHRNRNRSNLSTLRTSLKKFEDLMRSGEPEGAKRSFSELYAMIDKSKHKKAISRNAAARKKSRLTRRLNTLVGGAR